MKLRIHCFLLILFLLGMQACSGVGGPGGGLLSPDGAGVKSNDGGESIEPGTGAPDGPGVNLPIGSIPPPGLKAQALVGYACDSGSACPVVGSSEGSKVGFTQNGDVVAYYKKNQDVMFASYQPRSKSSSSEFSSLLGLNRWLLPIANALDVNAGGDVNAGNFDPNQLPDPNAIPICERPDVFCATVVNGEFEAFPIGTNDSTFHYFATDGIGVRGEVKDITPNKQMLYFMDQPQALAQGNATPAGENIGEKKSAYASAGGYGKQVDFVKEDGADPRIMVVGNYRERYNGFEAGNEIAFDAVNNLMSTDLLDGIGVLPLQENSFVDVGALASVNGAESYKHLKYTWDNSLRFITTPQANAEVTSVKIYSVLAQTNNLAQILPGANRQDFSHIRFLAEQIDLRENFRDSIVYDVDSHGCGLLVFEDVDGNKRIRMACSDDLSAIYPEIDGNIINGTNADTDFDDLIIYDETSDNPNIIQGKALLVDRGNHQLWQISYHNPQQRLRARDPAWIHADLVDANSIPMGATLKSFTITSDRKYLFAVNQDEDKVVAFKLKDEANKSLDIATIRNSKTDVIIKDEINWNPENQGKIQPNTLAYQKVDDTHEYLVVGSQALKGSVWFDVQPIKDQVTAKVQPPSAPVVSKEQVAPVDCTALMTQLAQTKDASLYSKLKAEYIAAGCK